MNNLTTRKIVLGLLMTCVLAFGVQGIAEAQTGVLTITSGNNQTKQAGQTFTIAFKIVVTTPENTATPSSVTQAVNFSSGVTLTTTRADIAGDTLTITPTANNAATPRISTHTYTLSYKVDDNASSGSVNGFGTNATVYVVPDSSPAIADLSFDTPPASGYESATDTIPISPGSSGLLLDATGANLPLRYSVSGGTLYVPDGSTNGRTISSSQTISSSAPVRLRMNNGTRVVSVYVEGQNAQRQTARVTIIHRYAQISKVSGDSPKQAGSPGSRLLHPFTVKVTDAGGRNVPGQKVTFISDNNGTFSAHSDFPDTGDIPAGAPQTVIDATDGITVTTDSQGRASIYLVLGNDGEHTVTAQFPTGTTATTITTYNVKFKADAVSQATATTLEKVTETDGQQADKLRRVEKPLTVVVRDQVGNPKQGVEVSFQDRSGGTLNDPLSDDPGTIDTANRPAPTNQNRVIDTDVNGEASIYYTPREGTGAQTVSASIRDGGYQEVEFTVNGPAGSGGGGGGGDPDPSATARGSLNISVPSTGNPRTVTVTAVDAAGTAAPGIGVQLTTTGGTLSTTSGQTPLTSTLTLPAAANTYTLTATTAVPNYDGDTETVTVTLPGTLSLEEIGARAANGGQSIRVTVREANGSLASGSVVVTLSGAISRTVPTTDGTGAAIITLPTTGGPHTVTLSATGYTTQSFTLSATGQTTPGTPAPTTGPAGVADSVEIDGSRQLSGTLNQAMRLRVRVVDANDNGVSDVRVTFRVLTRGSGTFAGARGNGSAIGADTDRNGYASATFTPSTDGDIIVRANAAGVSAPQTFILDVGEAADDTEPPSRDEAPSRDINPSEAEVHIGAGSRPPMLWVDGGGIYALVGASVERFAPSVDNALNLTVAGGKVYWTEQTGESAGTINSADLDGSDVEQLKAIKAVPMGIAVDTAARKLYWTNSRGRIQSADLDGSGIENVLQNLPGPKDIAVARGNVYWTEYDSEEEEGNVGLVNSTGRGTPKYISTGSDTPGSLVIAGNKVYWTERTGTSSGTINSANLNGSGAKQLKAIRAVPMGIAVDASRSKLYWTNSRGRVQSANLDGSKVENVVDGLGAPGDMVLSNSLKAPVAGSTTTTRSSTTADNSKYDVNGDGTVDRMDAFLVVAALGTNNNKYDVNGDGTVDIDDYDLVFENLDPAAAAAPPIVGVKLSAVQIDRLQEQIDLLIASGDRSPSAMRVLVYLQQLIATARPEKTQLLANYPNPFNPETWMPYELATDTTVKITIYNTQGVVIRTLELGQQAPGYYVGRDRAAYWDGRNALGEHVASGIYFYQLETDTMSAMRKMVILK